MSGSGTNRLIQSDNAMKKSSESALKSALYDANNEALKINKTKKQDKKKKK